MTSCGDTVTWPPCVLIATSFYYYTLSSLETLISEKFSCIDIGCKNYGAMESCTEVWESCLDQRMCNRMSETLHGTPSYSWRCEAEGQVKLEILKSQECGMSTGESCSGANPREKPRKGERGDYRLYNQNPQILDVEFGNCPIGFGLVSSFLSVSPFLS